ncbi:MAG: molybdate ABC transporter substrate-binding protein [Cyanobacteria bacterium P01_H01_bin.121]
MKRSHQIIAITLLPVFMAVGAAWRSLTSSASPLEQEVVTRLTISAAASLQDALDVIDPVFEAAHPGVVVDYNFASSGSLQKQVEQGAPVDVFFSAATQQMDDLQRQGLIVAETRQDVVGNQLVLVVPKTAQTKATNFKALTKPQINTIAVGEFRSVPAGQYAESMLQHLGLLTELQPKFVFGNSVRNVLGAVEAGNADAGLVYATDAQLASNVQQVAIAPPDSHPEIRYPIAILKTSAAAAASQSYIDFLAGPQAQAVFTEFGFIPAN